MVCNCILFIHQSSSIVRGFRSFCRSMVQSSLLTYYQRFQVPTKEKVDDYLKRFDANGSGHLEFPEFLLVAKEIFGNGRGFKDSIYFKAGVVIMLNMVIWPLAGLGTQRGLLKAGVSNAVKVPIAVWSFAAQGVVKLIASSVL